MSLILAVLTLAASQDSDRPKVHDPAVTLELVAQEPDLVTPTGIAVDRRGRVFVIENHTHQRDRRKGYAGPPTDRIKIFDQGKVSVFAEGFRDGMSLAFGPDDRLYLATRAKIYAFEGRERTLIIDLRTKGNYPHNGLAGLAFGPGGKLHFSLGENLGAPYTLVGTDGRELSGGGEGGSIYRCDRYGRNLERIGTGVWNCFTMAFAGSTLFAGDDDPDSSPPCRLLHVVDGADFGFRYRLGRDGTHPFQSWNGRLPGTLPMVAGLPQAPSGMVFTQGRLWITAWAGHVITAHTLKSKGASFVSESQTVIEGGPEFRPVGLALGPDGSIWVTDWVKRDYPVHGRGRLWRIRWKTPAPDPVPPASPAVKIPASPASFRVALKDEDAYRRHAAIHALSRKGDAKLLSLLLESKSAEVRLGVLLSMRRLGRAELLPRFLADSDPRVRRTAVQWTGEERLSRHAGLLRDAVARPGSGEDLFTAYLAARELIEKGTAGGGRFWVRMKNWEPYLAEAVKDDALPGSGRALALRMLRPDHPSLSAELLGGMMADPELRGEALRTLSFRTDEASHAVLRKVAGDASLPARSRGEAIIGLSRPPKMTEGTRKFLIRLLEDEAVGLVSIRSLTHLAEQPDVRRALLAISEGAKSPEVAEQIAVIPGLGKKPGRSNEDWARVAAEGGDSKEGELVFYHPRGPQCYVCHRVRGRGGHYGTDLSRLGQGTPRAKIIESILDPSREIAPAFVGLSIEEKNGRTTTGRLIEQTPDHIRLITLTGQFRTVRGIETANRRISKISLMPENLHAGLTAKEFRDLVAFLTSLK